MDAEIKGISSKGDKSESTVLLTKEKKRLAKHPFRGERRSLP
jgi:hypothetical protein